MRKLVLLIGAIMLTGAFNLLSAETASYCWHAKCDDRGKITFWKDGCYDTGVHKAEVHYKYNTGRYYTKCVRAERNWALSWAQNCAYVYSKFYKGYNMDNQNPCW